MKISTYTNNNVDPAHFLDLVRRLYQAHPFVIKTKSEEYLTAIDPKDPAHRFGTLSHIAIWSANRLCAHASVVVDSRKSDTLLVGHIESEEHEEVIAMLFVAIEDTARRLGVRSIVGPVNRNLWRTFRAPIDGDGAPFFSEPYLPNFMSRAFLRNGYDIIQESESTLSRIPDPSSLLTHTNKVVCMRVESAEIPTVLPSISRIASVSFRDTPFFFSIGFDEFCFPFARHSDSMERALLFVAKREDEIVGFLLGYRSPEAKPPGVVAKTMTILPEFRRAGVGGMLFKLFYTHALALGFENVYYSTMQKGNSNIRKLTGVGGSTTRCIRTYGLFEKTL